MINDTQLEKVIAEFEASITNWALKHNVWMDSSFKTFFDHFDDEPNEYEACVSVLCLGGPMHYVADGDYDDLHNEFNKLLEKLGFWFERHDGCLTFYAEDEELNQKFLEYFEWKWISSLVQPTYTALYEDLFNYFQSKPERMHDLSARQMEILIGEIFRNQGYQTELGSGSNDAGVDLRLYQKDEIDQITTLVQVKKYKASLPIKLEAVSGFSAIVDDEKANRDLFITTSRFLPVAKKFASRQGSRIKLADRQDITRWCSEVKTRIERDKSKTLRDDYIMKVIKEGTHDSLVGKIVVGNVGYTVTIPDFCVVLMDSPSVSLLMRLPRDVSSTLDPPYNQRGYNVPNLDSSILKNKNAENVFRAKKSTDLSGRISFWGQQHLYSLWDGTPQYFTWVD